MIISRTPFRVSFFGGGTDFPEHYREHGGAVLCTAIDHHCYITIHALAPLFKYRFKAGYSRTETVQEPSEFQHPLIREALLLLGLREGLEISHVSDLPSRTGLGSSSSFTVGLLNALYAYTGRMTNAETLARQAILIERERVGDPGGHQDQYVAAYGGFLRIDFGPGSHVRVRPLSLPIDRVEVLQQHLLLFYTGREESAEEILREQRKRAGKNVQALRALHGMVEEAERLLMGSDGLLDFGKLLHEAWSIKKGLSSGITNGEVDSAYEAARRAGALGGKLLGAGGRGFLLVFSEPGRRPAIREALQGLPEVAFHISPEGSRIIFNTLDQRNST